MFCPAWKNFGEKHKLKLIHSSCSQRHERETVNYDSFSVGLHLQSQGVRALHPVIMIPGVISTGLESWGTEKESIQYFRKRLWGSWSMMRALVLDKASWKRHIMLDKLTGLDPPGVKLRAAQGFGKLSFPCHTFLTVQYCNLSCRTCVSNTTLLEPVSRIRFDLRRGLLIPKSYRCCRFVRDLFEWSRRDTALTACSFITGYWIWSKILENLATLGYDP